MSLQTKGSVELTRVFGLEGRELHQSPPRGYMAQVKGIRELNPLNAVIGGTRHVEQLQKGRKKSGL